ncbi:hypothetical protein HPB50_024037 [Hyalomma asiaticum]|uniref:Uncharacterized protein n=1 Tax=Hyalomma asiaticum TaxID=266040 RepID=A0ACB7T1P4_HYAAI|nr:hypothetical protein HPB50_024037 [Hyalomma asiaticum]
MRYFSSLLGFIAAASGPLWRGIRVTGELDPQLTVWAEVERDFREGRPPRNSTDRPTLARYDENHAIMTFVGRSQPALLDLRPVSPWIGDQLYKALENARACETIPASASSNKMHRVPSNEWKDPWWSWIELYRGRIVCSDDLIGMESDCMFYSYGRDAAKCFMGFYRIRMRYRLRVAVKDPHNDKPLAFIEAGKVTASANTEGGALNMERDFDDGRFHIAEIYVPYVDVRKLTFNVSTITWNDKVINTTEKSFRRPIREAFGDIARAFITGPFLNHLTKAFEEARNQTS